MSSVGLYYDPGHRRHAAAGHVEQPGRADAVMALLDGAGISGRCMGLTARPAERADLELVHTPAHVDYIQRLSSAGGGWIDVDTYVAASSWEVARTAVGGCLAAVDAVLTGSVQSAFAVVRPPGHHAERGRAMGFCLFNNVALAARHAQRRHGLARVAILDFDVHHGNGTQEIFYDDPSVLFFSVHQYPFYPGTGHWEETGEGEARGTTMNVPLPAGCGDGVYTAVFQELAVPLVRRFRPDLILVSAGFDAHLADPLAGMQVTAAGYRRLAETAAGLAEELCGGRSVWVLEGGYHLDALAWSVRVCVDRLLGEPFHQDPNVYGARPSREPDVSHLMARLRSAFQLG
ncbi:MAG TPA: histone deacetylase [Dehalococcoidia bacterium]